MKTGLSYAPLDVDFPNIGLNVFQPSNQADPKSSPDLENFTLVKGIPSKRLGFWALGDPLPDPVIEIVEFELVSGGKNLVVLTASGQYKLDTSGDPPVWEDITATGLWSASVNRIDYTIAIGLDSSGVLTKWLIITNGVDPPLKWDGDGAFTECVTDIDDFVVFHTIAQYFNRVVIANVETASTNAQLIAWTEVQKLGEYTSGTGADGAGEIIIPGVKGAFIRLMRLGDRLVLYSEDSIAMMSYVGGDAIFTVEQVTDETRLVSARSIVDLGPFHVFLSQENVFLFDGSRLTRTMGDRIFRRYRDELAVSRLDEAFAFHDSAKQQVFFTIPIGESDHAIYVLEYDLISIADSSWTRMEYVSQPTAMGSWSRISTLTFDSIFAQTTPFNLATSPWNQGTTKSGFPVRVVACGTQVYVADDTISNDGGTAIDAYWDTIDFVSPNARLSETTRWLEVELEAKGTSLDIYYSVDQGENYVLIQSDVPVDSGWKKYRFPIDVLTNQIRIRVGNSKSDGALAHRWIRVWYHPGGPA